jgi:hypothetical protein
LGFSFPAPKGQRNTFRSVKRSLARTRPIPTPIILGHYASLPRNEDRVWWQSCSTCRGCSCRAARAWHSFAGTMRLRARRTAKAVFGRWQSSRTQVSTTLWRHARLRPQCRAVRYGVEVSHPCNDCGYWPISDVLAAGSDVRFQGQTGSGRQSIKPQLLTRNGRRRVLPRKNTPALEAGEDTSDETRCQREPDSRF